MHMHAYKNAQHARLLLSYSLKHTYVFAYMTMSVLNSDLFGSKGWVS